MLSSHLTAHLVPGHWKEEGASARVPRFWCAFPLLTQWPHLCLLPFWRQLPHILYVLIIDRGESSGDDATFSCSKTSLFFRKKEEKQFLHGYLVTGEFNIKVFFPLKLFLSFSWQFFSGCSYLCCPKGTSLSGLVMYISTETSVTTFQLLRTFRSQYCWGAEHRWGLEMVWETGEKCLFALLLMAGRFAQYEVKSILSAALRELGHLPR